MKSDGVQQRTETSIPSLGDRIEEGIGKVLMAVSGVVIIVLLLFINYLSATGQFSH